MPVTERANGHAAAGQVHAFVATSGYNGVMTGTVVRLPTRARKPVMIGPAVDAFLHQADLAVTSRRVYGASLAAFTDGVGRDGSLDYTLEGAAVASWFTNRYRPAAPATWNRELATLR